MTEQAHALGGTLEAGPAARGGFRVRAWILPERGAGVIRVVLADDQALVRTGFAALIDAEDDIAVVGEAGNGDEALRLAQRERPDVVLIDIRMPGVDGIEATRRITAWPPRRTSCPFSQEPGLVHRQHRAQVPICRTA
jgi:CheY-like chemotaxis protein